MNVFLFWSAVILLLHTYLFYPLCLLVLEAAARLTANVRRIRGPARVAAVAPRPLPRVSVVVAAHNEAAVIREKISNTFSLDYEADKLELVIGSDGSTDQTEEYVRAAGDPRIVLSPAARCGKSGVLNRCVPLAKGEIVVFTDANTVLDKGALRSLVRAFEDEKVGAVCGRLLLKAGGDPRNKESTYWTYESTLKFYEGKLGAVMGANGGLYAIRRSLFDPLPEGAVVDDLLIPMRVVARGYRFPYEPEALAWEEGSDSAQEFRRRARIAAGNFQATRWLLRLLDPRRGFVAFAFASHKLIRWSAPSLMLQALSSSLFLLGRPFYRAAFVAQLGFYALALLGRYARPSGLAGKLAQVASYFVTMNAAVGLGFVRYLFNRQGAVWDRTPRVAPVPVGRS